jgi:hypothetical protein
MVPQHFHGHTCGVLLYGWSYSLCGVNGLTPPEFAAFVYGVVTGATATDPQVAILVLRHIFSCPDLNLNQRYRSGAPDTIKIEAILKLEDLKIEKRK